MICLASETHGHKRAVPVCSLSEITQIILHIDVLYSETPSIKNPRNLKCTLGFSDRSGVNDSSLIASLDLSELAGLTCFFVLPAQEHSGQGERGDQRDDPKQRVYGVSGAG